VTLELSRCLTRPPFAVPPVVRDLVVPCLGRLGEALDERGGGVGDLALSAVDGERVPAAGHLCDLGDGVARFPSRAPKAALAWAMSSGSYGIPPPT